MDVTGSAEYTCRNGHDGVDGYSVDVSSSNRCVCVVTTKMDEWWSWLNAGMISLVEGAWGITVQ